jgi:hypothetical protein
MRIELKGTQKLLVNKCCQLFETRELKGEFSSGQLIEHTAKRPHINLFIIRQYYFRCHIIHRPFISSYFLAANELTGQAEIANFYFVVRH